MKKTFYLLTGGILFLGLFMLGGNAMAAEDATPPDLAGFTITPTEFDTSNGSVTLTIRMTVTDEGTVSLPQYSKYGIWQVENVVLSDRIGNTKIISTSELSAYGNDFTTTIANTATADSVLIEKEWTLTSSEEKVTVTFPENTTVTRQGGGSFKFYQMVNQFVVTGSELVGDDLAGETVGVIRFGVPGIGLNFSKPVTVSMRVGPENYGETLLISSLGEGFGENEWATESTCDVEFFGSTTIVNGQREWDQTDIDAYGLCTFTANHASYYAAQQAPIRTIVTGTKAGGGPEVRVFDTEGTLLNNFDAYANTWQGGINVAVGDVNGDGTKDIITSTRAGGVPTIKVFDINGNSLNLDFDAYDSAFRGGVSIAVGDIEGDGLDEIVVAPMSGGGPNIRTFSYRNGAIVQVTANFMAYDVNFRGGISLAIGDLEGDGIGEIITTPLSGGGPHVRVFGMRNKVFTPVTLGVMAYAGSFHGGMVTTMADLNGNGKDEVVTGVYSNGGPHVRAIGIGRNGALALSNPGFMAFTNQFRGGVSVTALDTNGNGQEEIIVGVGGQDVGWIKIMSSDGTLLSPAFKAYGDSYKGGVTLAAGIF